MPTSPAILDVSARQQARNILSHPPFVPSRDNWLVGLFHHIGNWLYGPYHWLDDRYHHLLESLGGSGLLHLSTVILAVVVVVVFSVVGLLLARRRARVGIARAQHLQLAGDEDPDELDRAAAAAEELGDHELGVRLRFRAGLARLEHGGLVTGRAARTRGQLSAQLRSPTFDALAGHLEEIVYAGRAATHDDSAEARAGWPLVPGEARSTPAGRS